MLNRTFYGIVSALALGLFVNPASSSAQSGNPRITFSQVGGKVVVKLPVERVCWAMGGNRDSLFGVSATAEGQLGVLFTDRSPNAVLELEALVTLRDNHIVEPTTQWILDFKNMGSTDGSEFVYAAILTSSQLDQVLGSGVISFTSNYQTERGLGSINVAHTVDFTHQHIDELARCLQSFG